VPDAQALADVAERVRGVGIEVTEGSAADCQARHIRGFIRFVDPSGLPCHIYHGAKLEDSAFHPGRGISGFVTEDQGLGHVFAYVEDIEAAAAFYRDILGFRVSDYILWKEMSMDIVFLRCNRRHHSIGFAHHPDVLPGQIEHFMVEVQSFDDVGRAYDQCQDEKVPIALSLGKHTNDHMQSFYLVTPSGFWLEYGYGGLTVPQTGEWPIHYYANGHFWGHRPIDAAQHMPKMKDGG
jgi:2,3-dihydroxybiphenyl 1,2-dioxygenase